MTIFETALFALYMIGVGFTVGFVKGRRYEALKVSRYLAGISRILERDPAAIEVKAHHYTPWMTNQERKFLGFPTQPDVSLADLGEADDCL